MKTAKTRVKLVSQGKLSALVRHSIQAIKKLLGLTTDRMSVFVNIAANTEALLAEGRRRQGLNADTEALDPVPGRSLDQISGEARDPRIRDLHARFDRKVSAHLRSREVTAPAAETQRLRQLSTKVLTLLSHGRWDLTPEERALFHKMQAAFATTVALDHKALVRVGVIYDHAIKHLTPEDMLTDPESKDPQDLLDAKHRLSTLLGSTGIAALRDLEGRPMMLATFLALSQVDPRLRRALAKMELPKDRPTRSSTWVRISHGRMWPQPV